MKPLLAIPSPMDIEEFWKRVPTIHADKLIIKYLTIIQSYALIRDYFLTHREYTHLVILPDDLLAEGKHFDRLKQDVIDNGYRVLSGVCTGYCKSEHDIKNIIGISINKHLSRDRTKRTFTYEQRRNVPKGIIEVQFVGLSLVFIERSVVEMFPFEGDLKYQDINNIPQIYRYEMNSDLMFCNNCIDNGIPIMVDTNVEMFHLRYVSDRKLVKQYSMKGVDDILVGKKMPEKYIIKNDKIYNPFEWPEKLVFPKSQFDITNREETYL